MRIAIITLLAALSLGFGLYTSYAISRQNDTLQSGINALLALEEIPSSSVETLVDECERLTNGLGSVLNDDRTASVALQTKAVAFAARSQDDQKLKEALFLLSTALEELCDAEQPTLQAIL